MPYIYHNTFNKKLTRKKGITAQAIEIFQLRVYSGSVKDPLGSFIHVINSVKGVYQIRRLTH